MSCFLEELLPQTAPKPLHGLQVGGLGQAQHGELMALGQCAAWVERRGMLQEGAEEVHEVETMVAGIGPEPSKKKEAFIFST